MLEFLRGPMPWYVAGAIIGLMVPAFLLLGNRQLGISANLRSMCEIVSPPRSSGKGRSRSPGKSKWKQESWNLMFAVGLLIGGFIGGVLLANPDPVQITEGTKATLQNLGVKDFSGIAPADLFSWDALFSTRGIVMLVIGGFLIGFGTSYGRGCTSGHGIMGLSMRSKASFIAVCSFFGAGIITSWVILPYILSL